MSTTPEFSGIINLDVRDSTEDWLPYLPAKAPENAPNILFILFDDTGLGAWSPFGGEIHMPCLEKIAERGLRYTQWHTAALCSPTRGMLLTGRNHHLNGNASITEGANGFPGQHARMPDQCATIAQILQDEGWSTFWVGKNHNVPETDVAQGSTKKQWPLAKGFDRFYGFIGGETNQWYPDLIADNHPIELSENHKPGFTESEEEEGGYHLSKDLADQAIQMIKDQKAANRSKPWYMWFCPGANHAPHQAPKSYIKKYEGQFDTGYEAYRKRVFNAMIGKQFQILPPDTKLTDLNPLEVYGTEVVNKEDHVRPWDELTQDEKTLFARMMEVYAALSEYTDAQIQRIIDYLTETGQLENTVIIYAADNGASGEGSPNGSVNENKFFNGYVDDIAENLKLIDELGSPNTYEHFPTGWAVATSTPFKMFKRYAQYAGGTCDPLVISWPAGIPKEYWGQIRHQYHHATDIVPTILEICDLKMPKIYKGVWQYPLSGVSMVYSFAADANGPTKKQRQYYAMLGTRGIWEDGWKAVSIHAPLTGQGEFDKDEWELYHVDLDRSESTNLAARHPDKLNHLIKLWFEEAEANLVLPLDDRSPQQANIERPTEEPPRDVYVYYPGTAPVPEACAVNIRGRSYTIDADVDLTERTEGVIFAHGSRFGGHSLFIKDGRVYYVYNFLGIKPEQTFTSEVLVPGRVQIRVEFILDGKGDYGESLGTCNLYVKAGPPGETSSDNPVVTTDYGTEPVASDRMRAQIGKFTLSGDGLCVGYDSADAVSGLYSGSNPFKNGVIYQVAITPRHQPATFPAHVLAGMYAAD